MHIPSYNDRKLSVEYMLENRHEVNLEWYEPWPGRQRDGGQIDCHMTIKASVHHCVYLYRESHADSQSQMTDAECLQSFIAVHWATPCT